MLKIKILLLFLILTLISCESKVKTEEQSQTENKVEQNTEQRKVLTEEQEKKATIALSFVNGYLEHNDSSMDWIYNSDLVTDTLKHSLRKMIDEAYKDDPELGLGYDPIISAQDQPSEGYELDYFEKNDDYMMLRGIPEEQFSLKIKLLKDKDNKWRIDGCGDVNL